MAKNTHPEAADRQRQLSRLLRSRDSVCAAEVFDRASRVSRVPSPGHPEVTSPDIRKYPPRVPAGAK